MYSDFSSGPLRGKLITNSCTDGAMIFSTQYYKPPFPTSARWRDDLEHIARIGFDTIYLSVTWAWVECEPQQYRFDDYDTLLELAGSQGLKVVLNLFVELQPTWIHRLYPESSMIDHMGRRVVSSQLSYFHYGLSPGCCTDDPQIRAHATKFMQAVAARYAHSPHLRLWDCWNEMRWMTQADGHVCYCPHTVRRYRTWLARRYGSLQALNDSWMRRYASWEDVIPTKLAGRTYTDAMVWQQFTAEHVAQDLRWRYDTLRAVDPSHPIVAHAAFPSIHNTGEFLEFETALGRGNDWQLAHQVDGYGCSHFPAWIHTEPSDFGARVEAVRCATGDKPYWIAELQGGAAGHGLQAMEPVSAERQARWVWSGIARGAKAVNFWCWRDEGFGRESGGFGLVGDDGYSEQRLQALAKTTTLLREHNELLDAYRPADACAGVVFEPGAFQLDWASHTASGLLPSKEAPYPAGHSLEGYLRAFERLQAPYDVVETSSTISLDRYRFLVWPWPLVVDELFGQRLLEWVTAGGTLLTEASVDAFNKVGLFKFPHERPLTRALGFEASGRRRLNQTTLRFDIEDTVGELRPARWLEELKRIDASDSAPETLLELEVGAGHVYAVGSFVGVSYWQERYVDFERFMRILLKRANALPQIHCSCADGNEVQWRFGYSGKTPLLFVINERDGREIEFAMNCEALEAEMATDLVTGKVYPIVPNGEAASFTLPLSPGGYHILRFNSGSSR